MPTCTFFGHRDCPHEVYPVLEATVYTLATVHGVDTFYVGEQGAFDALVTQALVRLLEALPNIHCYSVLHKLPISQSITHPSALPSLFPEGTEQIHPKFAIDYRNRWMLAHADFVVGYICHPFGGAAKFFSAAERQGKTVINLAFPACDNRRTMV